MMGCGCRGRKSSDARPSSTVSPEAMKRLVYEVFRNGRSTGRKFTTLSVAQSYANSIGGEVREVS